MVVNDIADVAPLGVASIAPDLLTSDFPVTVTPTEAETRLARESVSELTRLREPNQEDPRFRLQHDGEVAGPIALPLAAIRLLENI